MSERKRGSHPIKGTGPDKYADRRRSGEAEKKYQDELHVRWQSFIQRVRVHELYKCLAGEQRKLQVLRKHTDLDEIMRTRFAQLGVKLRKRESDEIVAEELLDANREERSRKKANYGDENKGGTAQKGMGLGFAPSLLTIPSPRKEQQAARTPTPTGQSQKKGKKREMNVIFLKTQKEEEEGLAETYPNLKRVLADSKYIGKAAVKMFRTRSNIEDEEFEEIVQLCDDKIEQQALREAFKEKKTRELYLHNNADELRRMLYEFLNSIFFVRLMLVVVVLSVLGIFLLTFETVSIRYYYPLQIMDCCIIGIFLVEAFFKIVIYKGDYFKQPWNLLDLLIITIHLSEVIVDLTAKSFAGFSLSFFTASGSDFTVTLNLIKSLRALRLLRVIKFLPNLQVVVTTIIQSMLSIGSIVVLMSLFMFVFAVMGRGLFVEESPEHFGNLWLTFVTLFNLLTLDDWFELLLAIDFDDVEEEKSRSYWILFGYLFGYIVIEYFIFLNLFVAVFVDNFQLSLADAELRKKKEALVYLEGYEKYFELNEDKDTKELAEENTDDDYLNSEYVNRENIELEAQDYFPTKKGTRENALLEHIFKDLCSIDFERYLFKRRLGLLYNVLDQALSETRNRRWKLQDADGLSAKNKEVLEQRQNNIY